MPGSPEHTSHCLGFSLVHIHHAAVSLFLIGRENGYIRGGGGGGGINIPWSIKTAPGERDQQDQERDLPTIASPLPRICLCSPSSRLIGGGAIVSSVSASSSAKTSAFSRRGGEPTPPRRYRERLTLMLWTTMHMISCDWCVP